MANNPPNSTPEVDPDGDTIESILYKGKKVKLRISYDNDGDCTKTFNELVDYETNKVIVFIDWSSYSAMTTKELELYLKLDCPTREDVGKYSPLTFEDLQTLEARRKAIKEIQQKTSGSLTLEL